MLLPATRSLRQMNEKNMNFKHKKLASLVLSSVLLSGCTVPGSHLSTDGKKLRRRQQC